MSLVSSRLSLIHRTTVQRDQNAAALNAAGAPASPSWADNLTGLPCRTWTRAGREQLDATTSVVVEDVRAIVALGTDVNEQDRLASITDAHGAPIVAGPIGIRAIIARKDHLELILQRIS